MVMGLYLIIKVLINSTSPPGIYSVSLVTPPQAEPNYARQIRVYPFVRLGDAWKETQLDLNECVRPAREGGIYGCK
jgi:hypothetical protein